MAGDTEYEAFDFVALEALAYTRLVISGGKLRSSPDFSGLAVHLAVGSTEPDVIGQLPLDRVADQQRTPPPLPRWSGFGSMRVDRFRLVVLPRGSRH